MDKYRDNLGFINLDLFDKKIISSVGSDRLVFEYDGIKYFYKKSRNVMNCYNEVIAYHLGNDFGLDMAKYDLASLNGDIGCISESMVKEDEELVLISSLFDDYFIDKFTDEKNNLEDIWFMLNDKYKEYSTEFMDNIVKIFLFDVLIGNSDRHCDNIAFVKNGNSFRLSKVFDNELMLSDISIYDGNYSLGIDRDDFYIMGKRNSDECNLFEKFLNYSSSEYSDYFMSKLDIISEDNINRTFDIIENNMGCKMNKFIKNQLLSDFSTNRDMINGVYNKLNSKVYKKNYDR